MNAETITIRRDVRCSKLLAIFCVAVLCSSGQSELLAQSRPILSPHAFQAGVVYREYSRHMDGDQWRVTDGEAVKKFPDRAIKFLPNPVLTIDDVNLKHAIAAEITMDRWGGHRGTINKRIRFNGNDWIAIPEISGTPSGIRPEMLMFQDNPVVPVPLEQLVEGDNTFQADCDEAGGFGWGQWGLYSLNLRIYYDPQAIRQQTDFRIRISEPSQGAELVEDPSIRVDATASEGIVRVEVVANYEGYDEDGDGQFGGWHESRFQLQRGQPNAVRNHVGTRWRQPYQFRWDTYWVPDQAPGGIQLIARAQDARGYWTVSEPVSGLTLKRDGFAVKLFRAHDVPEDFGVRVGQTAACWFDIDQPTVVAKATAAAMHLRTWHGHDGSHDPIRINDHELPVGGKNHHYDYDLLEFPASALKVGKNVFSMHSETEHHMLEVLWPGPAIVVRYELAH